MANKTTIITGPGAEPITLDELKMWLRIESDETVEDGLLNGMIRAARSYVEQHCGIRLISQTVEQTEQYWRKGIRLFSLPVDSITHIKYYDAADAEQTLSSSKYELDHDRRTVYWNKEALPELTEWKPVKIVVRYVAGYADAAAVPDDIKTALKLWIGEFYENRADFAKMKLSAVNALLRNYKQEPFE